MPDPNKSAPDPESELTPEETLKPEPGVPPEKAATSLKPEELISQISEMRKEFEDFRRETEREIQDARSEAAYYRNISSTRGRAAEPEIAPEPEPPLMDEQSFYRDPVKAAATIAEATIERERKRAGVHQAKQYVQSLRSAYEQGRDAAVKSNPLLFKGIEREVEDIMFSAVKDRRISNPQELYSPETWFSAAEIYRRSKGELDFTKYYPPEGPSSISTPHSESPAGTRSKAPETTIQFDEEADIFLEEINRGEEKPITKEEIIQEMKRSGTPPKIRRSLR